MAKPLPLPVWDRQGGKLVTEGMDNHQPTYESEPQHSVRQWVKSQPLFDWIYAAYENTRWSVREIEPFVRKYHIDMNEFEPVQYRSFAEFFDRRFRPGVRKFPSIPGEMGAFAEARYFAWDRSDPEQQFPVKGHSLSAEQILGTVQRARPFIGGPIFLVRLAPVDYHGFMGGCSSRVVLSRATRSAISSMRASSCSSFCVSRHARIMPRPLQTRAPT
jgi:phosphatidylserine decarboxylase